MVAIQTAAAVTATVLAAVVCALVLAGSATAPRGASIEYRVISFPHVLLSYQHSALPLLPPPPHWYGAITAVLTSLTCLCVQARVLSANRLDPRAVALLQASPRLRSAFEHAQHNRGARVALKQQLTILCDEGRSHPEYWSLKSELDSLDGGEDDSDVVDQVRVLKIREHVNTEMVPLGMHI